MRYTRRVLDWRVSSAFAAVVLALASGPIVGCSSSDEDSRREVDRPDAESADAESADVPDGGSSEPGNDAQAPRDAGPFDGAAPPIVCESSSCAMSLSTTRGLFTKFWGQYVGDPNEGFCALLHDGSVSCWGANGSGQLGRGDEGVAVDSQTPAPVVGLSNIVALDHTCALDSSGAIWCWGTGPFLRDGKGTVSTERTPVKLPLPAATSMSVSFETGCAIVDGHLSCWGANSSGQVAPTPSSRALPPTDIVLPPGAPLHNVVVGAATFVVREDGTMVSWGANPPLGRRSSLFPDPYPRAVDLTNIAWVDVAYQDACAITSGTGYCWGISPATQYSDLQTPRRLGRALPEPVVTPEPIRQIATTDSIGGEVDYVFVTRRSRWCACGVSGAVYCAGDNASGQVGDGTKNYAFEPVKVNLPRRAVEVKVTPTATCALLTSGQVFCWGSNFNGQLGYGKPKVPSLVPQEVVFQ